MLNIKKAYVSGPYRSNTEYGVLRNIERAREVAVTLWKKGYAAFSPHTATAFLGGIVPDDVFLRGDLAWLIHADVLVLVNGWENSVGSVAEHALAVKLGIPVYRESDLIPPAIERPDYEQHGWFVSRESHYMPLENVRYFVIHHEGASTPEGNTALALHRYHRSLGWAGIGYHIIIERDGTLNEGRPLWAQGAHAAKPGGPNHNLYSWGACLIGNLNQAPATPEQLWALPVVVEYWRALQPKGEVVGHRELPSMLTDCPGKLFDLDWLRKQLRKEM